MRNNISTSILTFIIVILFNILIIPHLNILFRPNLLLIFSILFSFSLGFQPSIWFWIISSLILDNFIIINFPVNSILFIFLFCILLFLSKVFDYTTKMSQIITGFILIFLYYLSWFILNILLIHRQNNNFIIYCIETLLIFVIIFKIRNKEKYNEKNFQKI